MLVCRSTYKAVKGKKKAVCVDSFGTAALGNGSQPESTEAGPRLSEEYQMLKLDVAPSFAPVSLFTAWACSLPALC